MAATLNERIAQRVRDAVEATEGTDAPLTIESVGERAGVALRTMRRRMTGMTPWGTDELAALADIFGCDCEDFLTVTERSKSYFTTCYMARLTTAGK